MTETIMAFMRTFVQKLEDTFPERLLFVGLQGSRARGEATETSDIDTVVILDRVLPADIRTYRALLDGLPHRPSLCGFFSGQTELLCWEPSDLFQFYHDTVPILGSLDTLLPPPDGEAICRAIRIGACNVYHGCVHNMLYDRSDDILRELYKSATFTVQAMYFRQTGQYIRRHADLLHAVPPDERDIVATHLRLKAGGAVCFEEMSDTLLLWSQKNIETA